MQETKIRIISPSANILDEPELNKLISNSEAFLKKNNLLFNYSLFSKKKNKFLSGTKEERAQDLIDAFKDKNISSIISTQGGNNSNDLLEILDYNLISKNAKPLFGLSDITVLLNVIALKSNIITYHGLDLLWGIGKNATDYTQNLLNTFFKENKLKIIKNPSTPEWEIIKEGEGEGILLGGCLPSFCLLLGTKYDPLELLNAPFLLILEDIGENKSIIKSKLTQLKQHNKFNLCKGIILGNFAFCNQNPQENEISIEDLAKEVFLDINIPVVRIQEIGHCVENIIIPIGKKGKLSCNKNKIKLDFL